MMAKLVIHALFRESARYHTTLDDENASQHIDDEKYDVPYTLDDDK